MINKWETISQEKKDDLNIFQVELVKRKNPENGNISDFVVLDSPDWVNIIPITKDKNVVLIEQYRHGTDEVTLEIPGGLIENKEEPRKAAERECLEETGYTGEEKAILIGVNRPNPAFQNNTCYSYVWMNCHKSFDQTLDPNEDIKTIEVPINNIRDLILQGKIDHSIVLTGFFFYSLKYGL